MLNWLIKNIRPETETAKLVLEINMIADALETLNDVTKRMHGIDEEVKQRFIEDFFNHLKDKVFKSDTDILKEII